MPSSNPANLPIEALRTVLIISECRSYANAARLLSLTEPGISAQIKKLERFIGGRIFQKKNDYLELTEKGKSLIHIARNILRLNDQIAQIGGATSGRDSIFRIGMVEIFADSLLRHLTKEKSSIIKVHCDLSETIAQGFRDGYFDAACFLGEPPSDAYVFDKWNEEFVWACGASFCPKAWESLPMIDAPRSQFHQQSIDILRLNGVSFCLRLESEDVGIRISAAKAGMGLMLLPKRLLADGLMIASDSRLPAAPTSPAAICLREPSSLHAIDGLDDVLRQIAGGPTVMITAASAAVRWRGPQ